MYKPVILFYKQLLHNSTLDRNIMVQLIRLIFDSCQVWLWIDKCRSSSWPVWKKKPHHEFMLTITTDHDIINTGGNCVCRICTTNAESRDYSKCKLNADDVQCNCRKNETKTNNYTRLAVVEVMHGWDTYQRIIDFLRKMQKISLTHHYSDVLQSLKYPKKVWY